MSEVEENSTHKEPVLTRVVLENYKSIKHCDVTLSPLTFLVGTNGAGKSNFLDALRFMTDALHHSIGHALRERGGAQEIIHRASPKGRANSFSICLSLNLEGTTADYGVKVASSSERETITSETCIIRSLQGERREVVFEVQGGKVLQSSLPHPPPALANHLYLVNAAGYPDFQPLYSALTRMAFYNPVPERMREWAAPDVASLLHRDGSNVSSVLERLEAQDADTKVLLEEFLGKILPELHSMKRLALATRETVEFTQGKRKFLASSMSDGTLRALGLLLALFQDAQGEGGMRLVGLEEPELSLHPAALGVLYDAIRIASHKTQVIVTSHSPELLDNKDVKANEILTVTARDGTSHVEPLSGTNLEILQQRLSTVGELLRINQLVPYRSTMPEGNY